MDIKEMLERHEGKRNKTYKCSAGKRTIGIGHNIDGKGLPTDIAAYELQHGEIADDMIYELLDADISDAISDCKKLYPEFESFTESRRIALIDFLFNIGISTATTFKNTNIAINTGEWGKAADGLLASKYAKQVGGRAKEIAELLRTG